MIDALDLLADEQSRDGMHARNAIISTLRGEADRFSKLVEAAADPRAQRPA